MIVVGGTYWEICEFPRYERLFGSGLRSAAAIPEISSELTEFYTFLSDEAASNAERTASTFDINLEYTEIPETISYHYIHNHSHPVKQSNLASFDRTIGQLSGNAILRFGMIEGSAIVDAERVVYDPQSEVAEHFYENGSQAEELALVLNRSEARAFSGEDSIDEMLDNLTNGEHMADVVVIKCGASGAIARTDDGETAEIPMYEPDTIWNIGSGDIFSAVFATYWAEENLSAVNAAEEASLATAYFCGTRNLPIPINPIDVEGFDPAIRKPTIGEVGPEIYLAAPFFDPGEFWLMEEVKEILEEEQADVFAPYFDVGSAAEQDNPTKIAQKDLEALENAEVVLALLDTNDPGTLFEIGYARQLGIPVIVYQTQPRSSQNTMLRGSGCEVYSDLSTAIFKALWAGL